ncbi:MAG: 16S rRNA (adenine(1518)-N(6)/adenine(1519)-N(6))-dimethyltransferase RsmA [Bryobacteraceae bacterium]
MPAQLGQHFLINTEILTRLAEAACGDHAPRTIEIGPGRGALTRHLLERTDQLHAVELDRSLVRYLERHFAEEPRLHVHQGDVLETDLEQWGAAAIAGNLPYYITSPTIEKFLNLDDRFESAVFLMQWEVAQRLLAHPGTRDYAYLTVATQLVCDVDLVCRVPPGAFSPPPKVDSGAVRLRRKQVVPTDRDRLLKFVSRCFTHKRKNLRNNLRAFYGSAIDAQPEANLRAEQLDLEQFAALYKKLSSGSEKSALQ